MSTKIELQEGRDFTTVGLVSFLTKKYGSKKTGKPFTVGDIQQYIIRGKLPNEYGGEFIEEINNEEMGIKIVRLSNKVEE